MKSLAVVHLWHGQENPKNNYKESEVKVIAKNTVELDDLENAVTKLRDEMLNKNHPVATSARVALNRMVATRHMHPTQFEQKFVDWLSDETVERWGSRFRIKKECRRRGN
jgi:hypothetical protein